MAYVEKIWFFESLLPTNTMAVYVKMKPAGEVRIDVKIPDKFMEVLLQLAQTAADQHEAQMKAEILGDMPHDNITNEE